MDDGRDKDLSDLPSYADHVGSVKFSALPRLKQDEFVRILFTTGTDSREWVVQNDVMHEQPYGIEIIVFIIIELTVGYEEFYGPRLYEGRGKKRRLSIQKSCQAIDMISGTKLAVRLREALAPRSALVGGEIDYNWREMEKIFEIDVLGVDDLEEIKEYLEKVPEPSAGIIPGLSHRDYKKGWDNGALTLYVDRGLATQEYQHSKSQWANWLPLTFLGGLIAFLPVMIFIGFFWGLAILGLAILSRKMLSAKAEDWVRQDSLANPERYEWYCARKIVWTEKI